MSNKQERPKEAKNPKPHKKKHKWVRTGRCQPTKCGAFCCRTGAIMTQCNRKSKRAKDDMKYYELQNMQPIGDLNGETILSNRVACAALRGLRCGIHKKRPSICKEFPFNKDQSFYKVAVQHGCTYKFKKIKL